MNPDVAAQTKPYHPFYPSHLASPRPLRRCLKLPRETVWCLWRRQTRIRVAKRKGEKKKEEEQFVSGSAGILSVLQFPSSQLPFFLHVPAMSPGEIHESLPLERGVSPLVTLCDNKPLLIAYKLP